MAAFSKRSIDKLNTCDGALIKLFTEVIRRFDCTILDGHRNEKDQNKYFDEGKSKLRYPASKHNIYPSRAVDVTPYPIDWENRERFKFFRGYVYGIASQMGIRLNKTIEWDFPHFELRG